MPVAEFELNPSSIAARMIKPSATATISSTSEKPPLRKEGCKRWGIALNTTIGSQNRFSGRVTARLGAARALVAAIGPDNRDGVGWRRSAVPDDHGGARVDGKRTGEPRTPFIQVAQRAVRRAVAVRWHAWPR